MCVRACVCVRVCVRVLCVCTCVCVVCVVCVYVCVCCVCVRVCVLCVCVHMSGFLVRFSNRLSSTYAYTVVCEEFVVHDILYPKN